jgi:hypothetical protein
MGWIGFIWLRMVSTVIKYCGVFTQTVAKQRAGLKKGADVAVGE